jgi:hypothetical protein
MVFIPWKRSVPTLEIVTGAVENATVTGRLKDEPVNEWDATRIAMGMVFVFP